MMLNIKKLNMNTNNLYFKTIIIFLKYIIYKLLIIINYKLLYKKIIYIIIYNYFSFYI